MNLVIAGFGALGGRLGAILAANGVPFRVFQRRGATFDSLRSEGLRYIDAEGRAHVYRVDVTDDVSALAQRPSSLCLVLAKAYQTCEVASQIAGFLAADGMALTLQNGLGNAEALAAVLGEARVAVGTCTYGAYRGDRGEVHFGGDGVLRFGPMRPEGRVDDAAECLRAAGFSVQLEENPWHAVWDKVVLNAAANPVSALVRCRSGRLLEAPASMSLMRHLTVEAVMTANAEGIPTDIDTAWSRLLSVLSATSANRTSMLQDVEAHRRTETDAISGAIVDCARGHGLNLPYTETVHLLLSAMDEG